MGYTNETMQRVESVIQRWGCKTIVDLGAQNNYSQPILPAPYMEDWYKNKGLAYVAIDISGENGALVVDLAYPMEQNIGEFDMLVDAGTSEHVGICGFFDMAAIYNCWKTKHDLVKKHGVMINENPKSGNWPGHGFNYYTIEFYQKLAAKCGYNIVELGEHPAMGNVTDGWNVHCILEKINNYPFISLGEFLQCGIKQS